MSGKMEIKTEKSKLGKIVHISDSEEDEPEHELSHYMNDRVKLMKQVLKIIKPKRIKSMAPDCIKDLDIEEINSMLLEELLGISNKRLRCIFNGQKMNEDSSSSTDPEEDKDPPVVDIISLDDISDDDFVIDITSENSKKHRKRKVKEEPPEKKIKKERSDKSDRKQKSGKAAAPKTQEESLMSVLELLELQARARAIRSQLQLEASKKSQEVVEVVDPEISKVDDSDTDDAVIIESPKNDEIVITSSESEAEKQMSSKGGKESQNSAEKATQKIKLVRNRVSKSRVEESAGTENAGAPDPKAAPSNDTQEAGTAKGPQEAVVEEVPLPDDDPKEVPQEVLTTVINAVTTETSDSVIDKVTCDTDEIVINVDEAEMDGILG